MTDSEIYSSENKTKLSELLAQQASLKQNLILAEQEWMDASEALDQAESNLGVT